VENKISWFITFTSEVALLVKLVFHIEPIGHMPSCTNCQVEVNIPSKKKRKHIFVKWLNKCL